MNDRNVVLTGFMGTGKSTVGRLLADRLGRPFIDVDAEIEVRAGRPVAELFADRGESGFRALEVELCREAAGRNGAVISTGGGALVDPANRAALEANGTIVCLMCELDEILRRLDDVTDRPLLGDAPEERHSRIEELMTVRADTYAALPHHVDTTRQSPESVVGAIEELLNEIVLPVRHEHGAYDVRIGFAGLRRLGDAMRSVGVERQASIAIVTNPIVADHYSEVALAAVRSAGYRAEICLVPDGEAHKRLRTIERLCNDLLDVGLDRQGVVVGLGGGVTTDIAGFAAATYLRGVRLVQAPTSLLAMVDASVGGKTGVDLARGKNLVGAFWQPDLVVIDPRVLRTLPEVELRVGLAEAIKHGVIGDPELFRDLADGSEDLSDWWTGDAVNRLARAVKVKIDIVQEDPAERAGRAALNLGHTVGHAIEAASNYGMRHGEAVAIGTVAATRLAVALGEAEPALVEMIEAAFRRWGLPIRCPNVDADRLLELARLDKKRTAEGLRWVLPQAIGVVAVVDGVPNEAVRRVLTGMGARSSA